MCTHGLPLNFATLPTGIYLQYRQDWAFFDQVQASNVAVSTLLNTDPSQAGSITYFQLTSYSQINSFTNGRMLHIRAYPTSNWDVVQQN